MNMLDLKNQELVFDDQIYPITGWSVWFLTPMGLITNLQAAIERMKSNDMDPTVTILPVAVALSSKDGKYEIVMPR